MPEILPFNQTGTIVPQTTAPSQKQNPQLTPPLTPPPALQVETPKPLETTTNPAGGNEPADPKLIALAKKEREIYQRSKVLRDKEAELAQKEAKFKPWEEASQLAGKNKLEALSKLGITYDELTQQYLNDGQLPPQVIAAQKAEEIVSSKLQEFEQRQQQAQIDQQNKNYAQALDQVTLEVKHHVITSDKYPMIKEAENFEEVTKHIETEFKKTGRIIPVEEAIQSIEQQAEDGFLSIFESNEKLRNKIFEKFGIPSQQKPATSQIVEPQKPITLTHKSTVAPPPVSPRSETWAEKKQRIIQKYTGTV